MDSREIAGGTIVRDARVRRPGTARRSLVALVAALAVALVVLGAWWLLRARHPGYLLTRYEVATVRRAPIVSAVEFAGVVAFAVSRTLEAPATSEVVSVAARPGDRVGRGQVLLELRSEDLAAAIAADEGLLGRAQRARERLVLERRSEAAREQRAVDVAAARAEQAAAAREAARELLRQGFLSRADADAAGIAAIEADAALAQARDQAEAAEPAHRLALAEADQDVEDAAARLAADRAIADALTVRSPFDGIVQQVAVRAGQALAAHAALATIVDQSSQVVLFEVPERQAGSVVAGQDVTLRAGEAHSAGVVVAVDAEARGGSETASATVAMTAAFVAEAPPALRAGSTATVEVVLGSRADALVLPRGAFLAGGNESWVYVITADRAVKTPAALGLRNATDVEVVRGVAAGDRVIVSSYEEFATRESVSLDPKGGVER